MGLVVIVVVPTCFVVFVVFSVDVLANLFSTVYVVVLLSDAITHIWLIKVIYYLIKQVRTSKYLKIFVGVIDEMP